MVATSFLLCGCINSADLYADETLTWKATLLRANAQDVSSQQEIRSAPWPTDRNPYINAINYARNLAELYIGQASKASAAKDAAAAGLLGAAGVAAGGLLYGAHLDVLKGAGLAAGAATSTSSYVKPEIAETALLSAAEALMCVAGVAQQRSATFRGDAEAASIVSDAILTIRLNLRKKLSRQLPDYGVLLDRFRSAGSGTPAGLVARDLDRADILRTKTAECIIRSGA
ncbi:hypothetical protein I6F11_27355 [Ensifer sp. NBAIM29]|nr:hypothetical protein [Ensifer sp. NBAIM29]